MEYILQFTLMTELREVVTPQDRSRFDDIVYRRHSLDNSRNYFNSRVRVSIARLRFLPLIFLRPNYFHIQPNLNRYLFTNCFS